MTDGAEVASVWIPPGGTEIAEEAEAEIEPPLRDLVGPRAAEVMELLERFDAAHPREEPHFYLSLLGTNPACAGRGLGMALLAENLERIDQEGMPAYLESSNPCTTTVTNGTASRRSASSFRLAVTFRSPPCGAKLAR